MQLAFFANGSENRVGEISGTISASQRSSDHITREQAFKTCPNMLVYKNNVLSLCPVFQDMTHYDRNQLHDPRQRADATPQHRGGAAMDCRGGSKPWTAGRVLDLRLL
jgi:hypothetical protein